MGCHRSITPWLLWHGYRAKSQNHHDIPFSSAVCAPKQWSSDSKLCYHKAEGLKQTPCLIHREYEMGSHVWDEIDIKQYKTSDTNPWLDESMDPWKHLPTTSDTSVWPSLFQPWRTLNMAGRSTKVTKGNCCPMPLLVCSMPHRWISQGARSNCSFFRMWN